MSTPVIAVIGAGNMGSSLITGLISNGYAKENIWVSDTDKEKLTFLQKTHGLHVTTDNQQASQVANIVILAIKPQQLASVAMPLASTMQSHKPLIISIAAGIHLANIEHWLGGGMAIVRAMPNTPALIGCGASALYANSYVTPMQRDLAEAILRAVGMVVWLNDEALMNTVTALSGSGPAYFFLLMEALQAAAEQLGLARETAHMLILQTALGAARLAIESKTSLDELRQQVTSPGGTTEKAISVLEENNIRGLIKQALFAAKLRSEELASLFEKEK